MLRKHSDRITQRMLPWVFLIAIIGILYILYSPYRPIESPPQLWQEDLFESSDAVHDTASEAQSLTIEEYQRSQASREARWEAEILAQEAQQKPISNTDEVLKSTQESASKPLLEVEQSTQTSTMAENQTSASESEQILESPDVSVTRGVFEKRLLSIGASNNAWQSIMQRKDISPILRKQLEGLVKRLAQPHKYVDILYSDYVRDGKADAANSKLLAVRSAQWAYFTYEEGGKLYFYDRDGNAPEPSMDRVPFHYTRISSEFNLHRVHPVTRRIRPHLGVDLKGAYGTPIASTGAGLVTFAGWQAGYGRIVMVQHPNDYETRYAHLSSIEVSVGEQVKRGQMIGRLGNSGVSTGAHLHYEVRINGTPHDPMTVKLPSYKPLRRSELPAFRQYADLYLQTIDEFKKSP